MTLPREYQRVPDFLERILSDCRRPPSIRGLLVVMISTPGTAWVPLSHTCRIFARPCLGINYSQEDIYDGQIAVRIIGFISILPLRFCVRTWWPSFIVSEKDLVYPGRSHISSPSCMMVSRVLSFHSITNMSCRSSWICPSCLQDMGVFESLARDDCTPRGFSLWGMSGLHPSFPEVS